MGLILDFGPEPVHGDGQGVVVNEVAAAVPQALQQYLPGKNLTAVLREGLEQLIFIGGNDQFFLAPLGGERGEVQRQPSASRRSSGQPGARAV